MKKKKKNLKNMKECDNSKIHINSNFTLSICLVTMFDILLLRPSLYSGTPGDSCRTQESGERDIL
jgi:hypothetical protein